MLISWVCTMKVTIGLESQRHGYVQQPADIKPAIFSNDTAWSLTAATPRQLMTLVSVYMVNMCMV